MKLFALIMLRCALIIMFLSSLLQNGTLATLREWEKSCQKLKEWAAKCQLSATYISTPGLITFDYLSSIPETKNSLTDLLNEVNKFPLEGMDELLDRRLQKPLKMALSNCEKLEDKLKHSGREDNNKYLESLVFKTSSIANGIGKEFNKFIMEVELELLETEFNSKIAEFAQQQQQQQQPLIDGDGFIAFSQYFKLEWKLIEQFIAFSQYFKLEWKLIEQMSRQLTSNDDKDTFRERLDNLAEKAMEETAPLKAIITEKIDELITKCQNSSGKFNKEEASNQPVVTKGKGPSKKLLKLILGSNKREQKKQNEQKEKKEEAKKKEINAKKEILKDIGMFDGDANKLLDEHEEGNTDFCAELEKAVEKDKEMVSTAYQVKPYRTVLFVRQMK